MTVLTLAVGGTILYFFTQQQQLVGQKAKAGVQSAQEKADAYKKNQSDMMKQLGQ